MGRFCSLALLMGGPLGWAATCDDLVRIALPNTTVSLAQTIATGEFKAPPELNSRGREFETLPAFCRVAATLRPTSDSVIHIEVWLPASNWNGKLQGAGNGGYGGSINFDALVAALHRGYAVASTDTGHTGDGRDATFALGHPEKAIDFGYRAVHEMTVKAKAIATAFYGKPPRLSYWVGCSTGGRQALAEAQLYPGDYDGILAGAPGNNTAGLTMQALSVAKAVHARDSSFIPSALFPVIHRAVVEACDALDGVKDGILEDPTRCNLDLTTLECKSREQVNCLTEAQIQTARTIYSPLLNPRSKKYISPGLEPGSELGWATMAGPEPFFYANDFWKYLVVLDAKWNYKTLNTETDLARALASARERGDADDPNLKSFFAHGGKLLQYHGWSDPNVPPQNSIRYFKKVYDVLGAGAERKDSYRLFMVPGMAHCGGGEGPNQFDMLAALEQWREQGTAPKRIVASRVLKGQTERTHPLCPYPQVAIYKGIGDTGEAENFDCRIQ